MIELAIDVGSGITKVRGPKGKRSFPSLAGPPAEAGFELKSTSGRTVSFGIATADDAQTGAESRFAVGEAAKNLVDPDELAQTRADDWCARDEYLALLYAAIAQGLDQPGYHGKLRLCTGLPQALYGTYRAEVFERLARTHSFHVDDVRYKVTIRREDLFVMPQVMGLFLSRMAKDKRLAKKRVAVLDIGTYTSDWTIVENLGTVQWASGGMAIGVSDVGEALGKYLREEYSDQLDDVAVNQALRYGKIRINGNVVALHEHVRYAAMTLGKRMASKVHKQWRGATDAVVIIGGGGARLLGPAVRALMPHAEIIEDREPIYSVVDGYHAYLTAIRHQTEAA